MPKKKAKKIAKRTKLKPAKQKLAKKMAKIVKPEGLALSQAETIVGAAALSDSQIIADKDGLAYKASINALEKRTIVKDASDAGVFAASRVPVVAVITNALNYRDNGAIVVVPESNQELLDDVLVFQKICEHISLPAVIETGTDVSENVSIPSKQSIEKFLVKYRASATPTVGNMISINDEKDACAIAAAMVSAKKAIEKTVEEWRQKFRRGAGAIETSNLAETQVVLIVYGQNSRSAKQAMNEMAVAETPAKVGFIRIHVCRPFPVEELQFAINQIPASAKIIVIDTTESSGMGGVMCTELRSVTNREISSFVSPCLLSTADVKAIVKKVLQPIEKK